MKEEYKNLISALAAFMEDLWLPFEDSIGSINASINGGMINREKLIEEFSDSMRDENFDWVQLAKNSHLLIDPDLYSNLEIKNYVKLLLQDYLFPENILSEEEVNKLTETVLSILQNHKTEDGWVLSYDLYDEVKKLSQFQKLEYFDLWKVLKPNIGLECKFLEDKEREMGFLRYSG